ncbi:MAG TPA: hypothetical protein VK934_11450 [Fimbriimonas sp.]|nr:hypothetical protein [Fimbriimonas sp.]
MRYFVIADDGSRYGPADVKLLNDWIEEGRLLPAMSLEEEGSRHMVTAASIEGLDFYILDTPREQREAPPGDVLALTFEPPTSHESEKADMFIAWAMVVITLCLAAVKASVGILGIFTAMLGLVAAFKAKDRGYDSASVAIAFNALGLMVWLAARAFFLLR